MATKQENLDNQDQERPSFPLSNRVNGGGGWPFYQRREHNPSPFNFNSINNIGSCSKIHSLSSLYNLMTNHIGGGYTYRQQVQNVIPMESTFNINKVGGGYSLNQQVNNVPLESTFDDSPKTDQFEESESIYSNSSATMATLAKLAQKSRKGRHQQPGSKRTIHDYTNPTYSWLLPGWLAEERVMDHGRVYKYFYDPAGNMYRSQEEVLHAWEAVGFIVLDL